ncbi:MAG TPA: hypothetical protein PKW35_04810 [Nannocystaceae bacterium]|nr:hypothetical protein [Nannocystaceae bacterium]
MPDDTSSTPRSSRPIRTLALVSALALAAGAVPACGGPSPGNERWVTTENTQVDIDWDAINKAYLEAEGPEDFERRVNEIYTGDEVISVAVQDLDEKTQVITGFFDGNADGAVADGEKIFSIKRDLKTSEAAQYQIEGHGHYSHYHSPIWDIAMGMMVGNMISSMFLPTYRPMYLTPYTTSPMRRDALVGQRNTYRAQNPGKFAKSSQSGRSYGSKGSSWGSRSSTPSSSPRRSSFGGGRFGLRDRGARQRIRLEA